MALKFLIDASLPRSVAERIRRDRHQAFDVRDINLGQADDPVIAEHAQKNHLALVTADFDFADIRIYPPENYSGLIVIDRPKDATIAEVLTMIEPFLNYQELISNLQGRLVIVDTGRIRIRPPLPMSLNQ